MSKSLTADSSLAAFLAEVRTSVDARLEAILARAEATAREAGSEPQAVVAALSSLVRRGGKRLRPALLAATVAACGGDPRSSAAIDAGCAWELLQAYFLAQDDWMDGDATRRGGPAVHVVLAARHRDPHLGASLAVLAGDLSCALAHRVLAETSAPDDRVREALACLSRVHEQVVLGQVLDLTSQDPEAVERVHTLKTGSYTARGPVEMGAILAGASIDTRRALDRFAAPLGVAFQLRDDLLGTFGHERETGKPRGSDLRARKRTSLVIEGLARASGDDRARFSAMLEGGDVDVEWASSLIERVGARAAVEARIDALLEEARSAAPPHDLLLQLASALVARRS